MNAKQVVLGLMVSGLAARGAWALDTTGWCSTVTDSPVLVCDDFDDYCADPPCDDGIGDDAPSSALALAVWPSDGCVTETGAPSEAVVVEENTCGLWADGCTGPFPTCIGTEFCGVSGRFSFRQTESQSDVQDYPDAKSSKYLFYGTSHHHDLVPRIAALDSQKGSVDGTDENPLVLQYVLDVYGYGEKRYGAAQVNRYVELTDGADRAPAKVNIVTCGTGAATKWRPQVDRGNAFDGEDHNAVAVGIFAVIDKDVCVEDGTLPITYRMALYDGTQWMELKNDGHLPPGVTVSGVEGAMLGGHLNYITLTVKSTTIVAELVTSHDFGDPYISTAVVPRRYMGSFAAIHVGNGACIASKKNDYVDNLALTGGVLKNPIPTGACCIGTETCEDNLTQGACENRPDGFYRGDGSTCATVSCPTPPGACCVPDPTAENDFCNNANDQATCETVLGGVFRGDYTDCSNPEILCCPWPFADADMDGDVDTIDFAAFQRCVTTGVTRPNSPASCKCFDRTGDGRINIDDFELFAQCASGANVAADPRCGGQ